MGALNRVVLACFKRDPIGDLLACVTVWDWVVILPVASSVILTSDCVNLVLIGGSGLGKLLSAHLDPDPVIGGSVEAVLARLWGLEPSLGVSACTGVITIGILPGSQNFSFDNWMLAISCHSFIRVGVLISRVNDFLSKTR